MSDRRIAESPNGSMPPHAVVLLSGGLDSYTSAAIAKHDGFVLNALTIFYGQRHAREVDAARAVTKALGVARHQELTVDLRPIGGGGGAAGPPPSPTHQDAAHTHSQHG